MFGFNLNGKNNGRKEMSTGVQLLASMLVCYPELYAVTYEPKETEITLDFVVEAKVKRDEMEVFADLVDKSVQTYHELHGGDPVWLAIDADVNGKIMTVHVRRQLGTMLRGELDLLTELFHDKFGNALQIDAHTLDALEPEFSTMQSNLLDQMFEMAQTSRIKERMIGMRDKDKVVVYNR
ncbi:hypothetical protein SAMN05216582_101173 [Selenomonas ruminantium]|uniref:Uncharacterized protein n=1 Tax=Selenomonas ruminantium TaxID=971 RepID=A0A1M6R647_SELRU|nr:hypothetical protein [Selenomonas ruminantium]SHK27945.1 hypothetical protein SAMN05216582_101173 [Selenomonas ruminantium]